MNKPLTQDQHRFLDAQELVQMFRDNETYAHIAVVDEWGEPRVTPEGVRYTVSGDRERAARRLAQVVRR